MSFRRQVFRPILGPLKPWNSTSGPRLQYSGARTWSHELKFMTSDSALKGLGSSFMVFTGFRDRRCLGTGAVKTLACWDASPRNLEHDYGSFCVVLALWSSPCLCLRTCCVSQHILCGTPGFCLASGVGKEASGGMMRYALFRSLRSMLDSGLPKCTKSLAQVLRPHPRQSWPAWRTTGSKLAAGPPFFFWVVGGFRGWGSM